MPPSSPFSAGHHNLYQTRTHTHLPFLLAGSRIPQVEPAHEQLVTNLRDLASWDARARTARELLAEMVQSRKEAAELAAQHNIRWGWS